MLGVLRNLIFPSGLQSAMEGAALCSKRAIQVVMQRLAWRKAGGRGLTLVKYAMKHIVCEQR